MSNEFYEPEGEPFTEALKPVTTREERQDAEELQRQIITARSYAYSRVFEGKGSADDVALVMRDLAQFCRGDATPWHADARIHALLTGRHEVFRRIEDFRTLPLDTLVEKYINGTRPSEI